MRTLPKQLPSLALAITLALGALTVWFIVWVSVANTVTNCWFPSEASAELFILRNGTPAIDFRRIDEEGNDIVHTLDGQQVQVTERWRREAQRSLLHAVSQDTTAIGAIDWSRRLTNIQGPEKYTVAWYFLCDGELHGHGHFVGYDMRTKLVTGYIGRGGFQPDKPSPDEQFSVNGRRMHGPLDTILSTRFLGDWEASLAPGISKADAEDAVQPWTVLLLTDDGLAQVNFKDQTVKYLRKDTDVVSAAMAFTNPTTPETGNGIGIGSVLPCGGVLLRTPDRVLRINVKGQELQAFVLPPELRDLDVWWLQLQNGNALIQPTIRARSNELFWMDASGNIVRHEKVDLKRPSSDTGIVSQASISLIVPCPGAIAMFLACTPWSVDEGLESLDYFIALGRALAIVWPMLLMTSIVGAACACLCYRRQRKYGLAWTGVWTGFVLLFGLPAYLGYLAHRTWPARLPCPNCGKRAPRDRPACLACGKDFPAPAIKGIEVFG